MYRAVGCVAYVEPEARSQYLGLKVASFGVGKAPRFDTKMRGERWLAATRRPQPRASGASMCPDSKVASRVTPGFLREASELQPSRRREWCGLKLYHFTQYPKRSCKWSQPCV